MQLVGDLIELHWGISARGRVVIFHCCNRAGTKTESNIGRTYWNKRRKRKRRNVYTETQFTFLARSILYIMRRINQTFQVQHSDISCYMKAVMFSFCSGFESRYEAVTGTAEVLGIFHSCSNCIFFFLKLWNGTRLYKENKHRKWW